AGARAARGAGPGGAGQIAQVACAAGRLGRAGGSVRRRGPAARRRGKAAARPRSRAEAGCRRRSAGGRTAPGRGRPQPPGQGPRACRPRVREAPLAPPDPGSPPAEGDLGIWMPPSRTAVRLAAGAAALIALWVVAVELPLLHWVGLAAGRLQGAGVAGALLWG